MARQVITVTTAWQQASTGKAVYTVTKRGTGALFLNTTEDDPTANVFTPSVGEQIEQTEAIITHVKASGLGWVVLVDEAT